MNTHTDENGVKYVLSLASPNKRISLKKVNIKDIPPSAMGRIIRCKKISTMRQPSEQVDSSIHEKRDNDMELTVVSTTQNTIIVGKSPEEVNKEVAAIEGPAKKLKVEQPTQRSNLEVSTVVSKESKNSKALELAVKDEEDTGEIGVDEYDDEDFVDDDLGEEYTSDESVSSSRAGQQAANASVKMVTTSSYNYVSPSLYKARRTTSDSSEKRRGKAKQFRAEWLDIDIFRDWLDCDPDDPYKARCLACNTVMNAGKSELEKHAAGAKHCRALEQMQFLRLQMGTSEEGELRQPDEAAVGQHLLLGEQSIQGREFQLEALNRIALAVETMSTNMSAALERLITNQESLAEVLQRLADK